MKSRKFKFVGRQSKPTLTWAEKCNIIYFHLHPNLGNRSCDLTCALFDVKEKTLRGWLTNAQAIHKWLPAVRAANPNEVVRNLPNKDCNVWTKSMVLDFHGSIDFSKFSHLERLAMNTDTNPVVMLTQGKSESQANVSTQKKVALARKEPEKREFPQNLG